MKTVIVATEDVRISRTFKHVFQDHRLSGIVEPMGIKTLLNLIDHDVDVFFLDLTLSRYADLDTLLVIRKMKPRMPVMVLSMDLPTHIIRCLLENGIRYIPKPVREEELKDVFRGLERKLGQ
jgi:DNA-binding response OmpR family regulator